MDKLKQLLEKTKPKTKIVTQKSVIEQNQKKALEAQAQEKKRSQQQKQKHLRQIQDYYQYDIRRKKIKLDENISEPTIPVHEVQQRLRALHQPITLFAESPIDRYRRLLKVQEFFKDNPNFDMKTYDQQFQQRLKQQEQFTELDAKYRDRLIEPRLGDDSQYIEKKRQMIKAQEQNMPYEQMCDQIFLWIHKVMRDWGQTLDQKYSTQQIKDQNKDKYNRFRQSQQDIKGFMYVLKKRGGDNDMIKSVYYIMNCCLIRQYIMANDRYIDLSIGNAPWPLGVAMLSITVRRNGPKVSHVLNDQSTRRWMQVIKRLISVCQQIYPSTEDFKKVGYSVKSMV